MDDLAKRQAQVITEFFGGPHGKENFDHLVKFAEKVVARARFSSRYTVDAPGHYVNEAIRRCLPDKDGAYQRVIDENKDLYVILTGVIRSVVSHELFPSPARQKVHADMGWTGNGDDRRPLTADDFGTGMWDEECDQDLDADAATALAGLMKHVEHDVVVLGMLKLLIEEQIDGPAELIAKKLGITVEEVYNARKRMARLLSTYRKATRP